jgi:aminopeptidase-like protein
VGTLGALGVKEREIPDPYTVRDTTEFATRENLTLGKFAMKSDLIQSPYNKILESAMVKAGEEFYMLDFCTGYGNDERVFGFPGLGLPALSLQKSTFDEYHTSADTPDIINLEELQKAFYMCRNFVEIIERNYIPKWKYHIPPWLSKRGLYNPTHDRMYFNINGKNTILELTELGGFRFLKTYQYVESLRKEGLVDAIWRD